MREKIRVRERRGDILREVEGREEKNRINMGEKGRWRRR